MESTLSFREKISSIVCETLTIDRIEDNLDLFESGILDSLALVSLMVALEEGFEVTISPEDLDMEDYRSVESMEMMLKRLLNPSSVLRSHG